MAPPQTSGKAIGSLILGFFSFLWPAAIVAIILGHWSRSEIRNSAGRLKGAGMALAGLILGYLGVAILPILIITAIAIPNLLRARTTANEASAIAQLRKITAAQNTYAAAYPEVGYSCELAKLGGAGGSPEHAGLIDTALASGRKNGYEFVMNCGGKERGSYHVAAYPIRPGSTGMRAFCTDQTEVIRADTTGSTEKCLESGLPVA